MKKNLKSFFLFFIFLVSCTNKKTVSRADFIIGTICSIKIPASKNADAILEKCFAELKRLDKILSANDENSELSKLNTSAFLNPVKVSPELLELVAFSKMVSKETDGAFELAIGSLVKLWGIGFENERVPHESEIKELLPFCKSENIKIIDEEIFLETANSKIDLGAVGKGYAADRMVEILKSENVESAIINLGGNIYVLGKKFFTNENWKIGLRNPSGAPTDSALVLQVSNTSVVTSGTYERCFEQNGVHYHHILDPKTGYPVKNNLVSVSVICENSTYADALSTAFLVLGYEKSLDFLKKNYSKKISVVFMFKDGTYKTTNEQLIAEDKMMPAH